ncbi:MAG: GGDEF domain-containing protein [Ectothiorhodospiraceae bacterium]|nr:GGDEF domain-containing protein [Ectothiorhodospiraceae bacterium]
MKGSRWLRWRWVRWWLLGGSEEPFRQVHHAFMLLGVFFLAMSALINYAFGFTPTGYALATLLAAPFTVVLWWRSRWRGDFARMAVLYALLLALFVLPGNWLFNGGMDGPTPWFYLIAMIYVAGALEGLKRWRLVTLGLLIVSPMVLMLVEALAPGLVHGYASRSDRVADLAVSYALAALMLGLLAGGHARRFQAEIGRTRTLADKLAHQAHHDSLTGLGNRRYFEEWGDSQSPVSERSMALLLLDLDHFKQINDRHGHAAGDHVLQVVADCLRSKMRSNDLIIRYGGEEFLIVLLGADLDAACAIADQLRQSVAELDVEYGGRRLRLTISIGVAGLPVHADDFGQLVRCADIALYQAKAAGRDCVRRFTMERPRVVSS